MNLSQSFTNFRRKYSQSNRQAMRNPWFIGWLILLATFLSVNALFVFLAVSTNPGLVVDDYYEQGRQYEAHALERIAAQKHLNWTTRLEIPQTIVRDLEDVYRFSAVDTRGVPVDHAVVKLLAYRPSDAGADFVMPMQEFASGLYEASVNFPLPGVWDVKVEVQSDAAQYEMSHRIFVTNPPPVIQ